ncbi:MAG TPA: SDR family oxidoreductase [Candidatus Angelobacter sp.]|jgi:3-oxoacyl-[acyl-carrier protein] reductase/pteridine reductase|nr:SDR family oxidoreductase [Candidatus Angelobacter sp.]
MAIPPVNLEGKTAIITGGAVHLGRAIALAMAEAGAQVAFTYLESKDAAEQTLADIKKMGGQACAVQCDIRDGKSITAAVEAIEAQCGRIDILVNNAGFYETVGFNDITEEQWDNMFAINVRAPFLVTKHCVSALRSSQGRIINLGSLGGAKPWITHAHYCSSKAALHMLSRVTAKALAPEIMVNCVAPGMIGEEDDEAVILKRFAQSTPMQNNGRPEDVVSAVMYFATAPRFITGQILTVDGGLGLR